MNKKRLNWIALIVCVLILTVGTVVFVQITKNHQANEQIIKECFEKFTTDSAVVVKKEGFWSPVSCEKE